MQPAYEFLAGKIPDHLGRTVHDYLAMPWEEWHQCHDVVQWAFPTTTPSAYNPNAPVLDKTGVYPIDKVLTHSRFLLNRYFDSLGLHFDVDKTTLDYGPDWSQRQHIWVKRDDHQYLRLTRILEWTGWLHPTIQRNIYNFLMYKFAFKYGHHINTETVVYWVATYHNERYHIDPK